MKTNRKKAELDHDRVFEMKLEELSQSPLNETLYRPIDADDPEIIALAASIELDGVLVPLSVTTDDVIQSGHRRFVAAKLAGLGSVPCIRVAHSSKDPGFLRLLGECNRQREKTFDEVFREAVVRKADPEEAYEALITQRRKKAGIKTDFERIEIVGTKTRCAISAAKMPLLKAIKKVMNALRQFWPLDDRSIHYELLGDPPLKHASKPDSIYQNDSPSYHALTELLTRARLEGQIPMDSIDDATRPMVFWKAHASPEPFIRSEIDGFLNCNKYFRNLLQSQPNLIEIVGEKNTLKSLIRPIAFQYCMTYTLGRGYCSLSPRYQMSKRFRKSGKEKLVLLFLSDFDPDGREISRSFARSMRDDFDVPVEAVQVMITAEQAAQYNLPPKLEAKAETARGKAFVAEHGHTVYEVEALPMQVRQRLLREAIDQVIDREAFNAELRSEKADAAHLDEVRRRAHAALGAIANTLNTHDHDREDF